MKVNQSNVQQAIPQPGRNPPGTQELADGFQNVLRNMEKSMWGGAGGGIVPAEKLPQAAARQASARLRHEAPAAAQGMRAPEAFFGAAENGAQFAALRQQPKGAYADGTTAGLPETERRNDISPFLPAAAMATMARPRYMDAVSADRARPATSSAGQAGAMPSRLRDDDNPLPWRVTLMAGEAGMSAAVRTHGADPEHDLALQKKALAGLRRLGLGDARTVINGQEHHSHSIPGASHGN